MATDAIRLMLPFKVLASVNRRTIPVGGRQILAPKYRRKKEAARLLVASQTRDAPYLEGPVRLEVDFYFPDERRRDAGNWVKLLEDALEGIIIEDDRQIRQQEWRVKQTGADDPRVEIAVKPLPTGDTDPEPEPEA